MIPGSFNEVARRCRQVPRFFPFLPPSVCGLSGCIPHGPRMAAVIPDITSLCHEMQRPERGKREALSHPHVSFKERRKISPKLHFPEDFSTLSLARILSNAHPRSVVWDMVRASDSQLWLRMNWGVLKIHTDVSVLPLETDLIGLS